MLPFFLTLFLASSAPESNILDHSSLEFVYEVSIGSTILGELTALRKVQADSIVYLVTSDLDAQVGIRIVQDYKLESVYRDGTLARSELLNVVNDKVRADTKISREGDRYLAYKGDSILLDRKPVDFSIVRLFFTEPQGQGLVFSENFAEDLECNPETSDLLIKYCLHLPDRTKIFYYYDKGICKQFEVRLVIFNVKYSLKEVSTIQ